MASIPHLVSHLDDEFELVRLGLLADFITQNRAGKAALRTQGELGQGKMPCRLPDAEPQFLGAFQQGALGAHEPKNHNFIVRNQSQRLE